MARTAFALVLLLATFGARAGESALWRELTEVWADGRTDLYLPLHTHHLRFAYDRANIERYQETPWGFGLGSSLDEGRRWRGLYAMAFQDSHYKPSYMAGYGRQWLYPLGDGLRVGGGFTVFVMSRADIGHYTPFPGILPTASVEAGRLALEMAYVPGGHNNGNILFFWARVALHD